jgi:hypothetical protein
MPAHSRPSCGTDACLSRVSHSLVGDEWARSTTPQIVATSPARNIATISEVKEEAVVTPATTNCLRRLAT